MEWAGACANQPALDDILQLANVARPVVALERLDVASRDFPWRQVQPLTENSNEVCRQQADIRRPFAKRQHLDREDAKAIKEVLAEAAGARLGFQIAIRGRNNAHVDTPRRVISDTFEFPLLQHAQQFALQVQRNLSNFVEKNRSAIGELESTDAVPQSPREGTLYVPKELALEEFLGDRTRS